MGKKILYNYQWIFNFIFIEVIDWVIGADEINCFLAVHNIQFCGGGKELENYERTTTKERRGLVLTVLKGYDTLIPNKDAHAET